MSMHPSPAAHNLLLAALPADFRSQLASKLTAIALPQRLVLCRPDAAMPFVVFPETGMISLVSTMADGMQAEVGIIGHEGLLGTSLLSGIDTSFVEAIVQIAGTGQRMSVADFRRELDANEPFRAVVVRYNEALQAQVMQTAACNANHGLEQRLARWLLMAHDRSDGAEVPLTQEFMAMMLGVHRPSITVTAGILARAGILRYAGGRVTVLDRGSLEAASCECYQAVQRRFHALLG